MNKTYLYSVKNIALSLKPSRAICLFLMVLFVGLFGNIENTNAAVRTASVTGNWNDTATWGGSSVPTISDDVVIPNGKTVTITADAFVKSIVVNNGGTLNINSPAVLTVGTIGTPATTQVVDFQNGSYVNVYTGASMIVYGLLNNSNNSDNVKFDGTVSVDGNITGGNGSKIIGSGSLSSTGTVDLSGSGTIFTSGSDCTSGNGCNYGCSTNTISSNQTICSNSTAAITGNSVTGYSYQWQSSTISSSTGFSNISGATSSSYTSSSLTTTTYYRRIVSVSGCSSSNSNVIKATVIATPTTANAGADQANCNTATFTLAGNVPTVGTGLWSVVSGTATIATPTSNTSGVTGVPAGTSVTLRWTISNGACTASTDDVVLTNNVAAVGGIVSGGTTICSGNTSGTLTLSGHTGTVIKWQSLVSPSSTWTDITNTATTYTSGILTATTQFRAVVQSGNCSTANSSVTTVTVSSSNTWTGATNTSWFTATNWSCGSLPTASSDVTIPNVTNKPIIDDSSKIALANTLTVSSGSSLKVNSGNTLTTTNEVTVAGSLTFEDTASLVQINDAATNSGNITYKRGTTTKIISTDYVYWSSPVLDQTLQTFSPNTPTDKFYSYNANAIPENWKQEAATAKMLVGTGYIIYGPKTILAPSLVLFSFIGKPNNGIITTQIGPANTSNLIGNPYPSAIDADKFLAANTGVIDGTLYFWTHNTPINNGQYTDNDYAVYNTTGGTASALSDPISSVLVGGVYVDQGKKPNGKIAAGQAFFTTSIATGNVVFNNSMRLSSSGATLDNTQFFKIRNPKTKTTIATEKHRIWLNMTNTEGAFKQTLVGYVTDATNDYDSRFDGESFDANKYVDFYSVNQDKNLVIQGRALPFDENDEVPLGYRSEIDGDFTVNIDQVDGLLANQPVFIEDKSTNTVFDLKTGNYTFNTKAGTFNDRFVLRYTNKTTSGNKTLGLNETEANDGIIVLYSNNYKTLIVKNNLQDVTVNSVTLFNMLGQKINSWDVQEGNQTNIQIPIKNLSSEMYIVKVKTTNGETRKKIMVN